MRIWGWVRWVVFFVCFYLLCYWISQQENQAKAKAFKFAIEKAETLGYEVNKISVSQEKIGQDVMVVAFQNNKQSRINDLEIYMRINECEVLGTAKDVDPQKDRGKIILGFLNGVLKKFDSLKKRDDSQLAIRRVKQNLLNLSMHCEQLASQNNGYYSNHPDSYLANFCGLVVDGFKFTCDINSQSYTFTATRVNPGTDSIKKISITTGGVLKVL